MKNNYIELSGAEFDESSDIAIRLKVLAGEIFNAESNMEWLKRQMFVSTASGEYLDYLAEQRGLERIPAAKARGSLYFTAEDFSTEEIIIPQGTVVSTADENPIRIYTTEPSRIPPMTKTVIVPAEAELAGFAGNILASSAYVPVNVPSGISAVGNNRVFTGGRDVESDNALRERIKKTYDCMPNGMNCAYYQQLAMTVDGVGKVGVVPTARGAGTVNVYVSGNDNDVSDKTLAEVTALLQAKREINVDLQVFRATYIKYDLDMQVVSKHGYSDEEVIEKCTAAFEDYLSTLPAGGKLYLSALGKYLLDTDCIENYEFDPFMHNFTAPGSEYFVAGDINIEVV